MISYIGPNDKFFNDLKAYCASLPESHEYTISNVEIGPDWEKTLFEGYAKVLPHLIIANFIDIEEKAENATQAMAKYFLYLKRNNHSRSIPIVGIFNDKVQLEEARYLFGCGLLYGYIKGSEVNMFIIDSFYFAFNEFVVQKQYAVTPELNLKYDIKCVANVSQLGNETLQIETDVEFEASEELNVVFNLFDNFKVTNFEVKKNFLDGVTYNYLNIYDLKIPFVGPWDDVTDDSLEKETYDEWLEEEEEGFNKRAGSIIIYDSRVSMIRPIADLSDQEEYTIYYQGLVDEELSYFEHIRPFLVVFQMATQEEERIDSQKKKKGDEITINNAEALGILVSKIKGIRSYEPIVMVFNSRSTESGLRIAHGYNKLMSVGDNFDTIISDKLFSIHKKMTQESGNFESKLEIPLKDFRNKADVSVEAHITSLSEHEITFYSHAKIPMYSVVKILDPTEAHITIIPPIKDLRRVGEQEHYMGIIHSISEKDRAIFRKFVNQIIFKPPTEFKFEQQSEEDAEKAAKAAQDKLKQEHLKIKAEREKNLVRRREVKRAVPYKGKSKL